jgi:uncharacterized protein YkwD
MPALLLTRQLVLPLVLVLGSGQAFSNTQDQTKTPTQMQAQASAAASSSALRGNNASPGALLQALNNLRAKGCGGRPGQTAALQHEPRLSATAAKVAGGATLAQALRISGYRAPRSILLSLRGYANPQAIAQSVAGKDCASLLDPDLSAFGFHTRGDEVRILLAAVFSPPAASDAAAVEARVLELVNAARSKARLCGAESLAAVAPVRLNERLRIAAAAHANDMATHSYFSHAGRDGAQVSERAKRAGYAWRSVGENLAAGQMQADLAVQGWLKSPSHCANLMKPQYTDMGLAYAVNLQSESGIYWVQVFGLPQ